MLRQVGLLPPDSGSMVPYATRLFGGLRGRDAFSKYGKVCGAVRRTFARPVYEGDIRRRFPTCFIGLWHTVSSVDWVWSRQTHLFTAWNRNVAAVRHAVALDEGRCFFRQNLIRPAKGQGLRQVWFPGVHAKAGGGYPEQGRLWQAPFAWVVAGARDARLLIDGPAYARILGRTPISKLEIVHGRVPGEPWSDTPHESLRGA